MKTGGVLQNILGAFIVWLPCSSLDPLGLSTSKHTSTQMICPACSASGTMSSLFSIISSQAAGIKSLLVTRSPTSPVVVWRTWCMATKWWIKKCRWKLISNYIYKLRASNILNRRWGTCVSARQSRGEVQFQLTMATDQDYNSADGRYIRNDILYVLTHNNARIDMFVR